MARRKPSAINALIAVDKPIGCTSHDVVAQVRRSLGERRVGHAGTLDPLASGVMVVGIGQATRLLGEITLDTKSYLADIRFGFETNTDDAEGEPSPRVEVPVQVRDRTFALGTLAGVCGPQMQVPPAFSAISVGGVRSYKRARAGDAVELPARPIEVLSADLIGIFEVEGDPVWTVSFTVSKGTYIRALARDLGRAVGSAAHLSGLRRTASGMVTLKDCLDAATLDAAQVHDHALDPLRILGLPAVEVSRDHLDDVLCGRKLSPSLVPRSVDLTPSDGRFGLIITGELRALASFDGRALVMNEVFPQGIGGVCL